MSEHGFGGHPFRQVSLIYKGKSAPDSADPTNYPSTRHELAALAPSPVAEVGR